MRLTCHPVEISSPLSTVILADDLTGACDSAAAFAIRGRETRVSLNRERPKLVRDQVVSYSLETRNLPPEETSRRMNTAASQSLGQEVGVLFCKIDSAGRGPIGEAVLNALHASGYDWAVFSPSFPEQGRTMSDGQLEIAESPGAVRHVTVESLFPRNSMNLLGRIACGDPEERERQMRAELDAGKRILICDARTENDLAAVVQAAMRIKRNRVLWCGSAGLAHALAEAHCSPAENAQDRSSELKSGEVSVVFAGTPHDTTAGQIEMLADMEGVIQTDCASGTVTFPAKTRCIVATVHCGMTSDAQVRRVWKCAENAGGARALILTGGDTASLVLRALSAESIWVRGQVSSGIPWGVVEGGTAAGLRVVTKSGGFGNRNALLEIVRFLEQMP